MPDDNISTVKRYLKDYAVYWGVESFDDNGKPVFEAPIEIRCRWEEKSEQYLGRDGNDHMSNAVVMVDRDLLEQGVLWHGKLQDLESQFKPFENEKAYEIKKWEKIPDRNVKKFFRRVYL